MYRVLVFGITENPGGVESFILNYYRKIDKEKIQFDFLCNTYEKVAYEEELVSLGGRVFHIASRRKEPFRFRNELEIFMKKESNKYQAVWVNVCSLANIDYLKVAKKYGIKKRIIHSHNSKNMDKWLRGIIHNFNKYRIGKYATNYWACSKDAAEWFYNKKCFNQSVIINNAISLDDFSYCSEKRDEIRNKYHIGDSFLIGNVGRLHFQKNQMFALDIFACLVRIKKNCILMLVGQGEDEQKLKRHAQELEIDDKVIFTGVQTDIRSYLSAFDLFLFPSVFEGFGIAGLEAQANGLPVIASEYVIPRELGITDSFYFKKLEDGADAWAREIIRISEVSSRSDMSLVYNLFTKAGFNIDTEVKKLENLLMSN